jgi:hypothetical protein
VFLYFGGDNPVLRKALEEAEF